jgi:hypothetical protein
MFEELGFSSVEEMICDGYGLNPEEVEIAVRWLELKPHNEPISLEAAVKLGKHGGDRGNQHTGGKRQADNVSLAHGTSLAYTLARLKRDLIFQRNSLGRTFGPMNT